MTREHAADPAHPVAPALALGSAEASPRAGARGDERSHVASRAASVAAAAEALRAVGRRRPSRDQPRRRSGVGDRVGGRQPPKGGRTIRGRVVGGDGPYAVLAGESFHVWFANLGADRGATTAADGSFAITGVATDTTQHVMAVSPVAWSEIVDVPPGTGDATVELHAGAATGVEGTVTYAGGVEAIELTVTRADRGVMFMAQTERGKYRMVPLPPGTYELGAGLARESPAARARASSAPSRSSPARSSTPTSICRRASRSSSPPRCPKPELVPSTMSYSLHDGASPAPQTAADARKGALDSMLLGGQDATVPMQFHDRTPGAYIVCVEAVADAARYFGCAPITLAATPAVRELTVLLR